VLGDDATKVLVAARRGRSVVGLTGLVVSFFSIIFAYPRPPSTPCRRHLVASAPEEEASLVRDAEAELDA
jgi:hypothetical protein